MYRISGHVKDQHYPDRVKRLSIDALAKGPIITHPFGRDVTDAQGFFDIRFSEAYLLQCFPNNAVNKGRQTPCKTAVEFWGDWLAEKLSGCLDPDKACKAKINVG